MWCLANFRHTYRRCSGITHRDVFCIYHQTVEHILHVFRRYLLGGDNNPQYALISAENKWSTRTLLLRSRFLCSAIKQIKRVPDSSPEECMHAYLRNYGFVWGEGTGWSDGGLRWGLLMSTVRLVPTAATASNWFLTLITRLAPWCSGTERIIELLGSAWFQSTPMPNISNDMPLANRWLMPLF